MLRYMYLIEDPKNQAEELCNHLSRVFLFNIYQTSLMRDFERHARANAMSRRQMKMLHKHASPSARSSLDSRHETLWHMFNDFIKKGITLFETKSPVRQEEILKEMIIYSKWTMHNFPLILNIPVLPDPPPYPATQDQITDFPTALAYLGHSVVPVMKAYLQDKEHLSEASLSQNLEFFEKRLVRHVSGLEILKPIPMQDWQSVSLSLSPT